MSIQKIFFSYSRNDAFSFASQLATDLGKAGFDVWIDQQDIGAGLEWDLEIEKALDSCDCLLFIESEKSVTSNNVLDEVYYALGQGKKVIPVIYHDSKTPFRLQRLQHIDLSKDYDAGLVLLINELKAKPPVAQSPEPAISPVHQPGNSFSNKHSKLLVGIALLGLSLAAIFIYYSANKHEPGADMASVIVVDSGNVMGVVVSQTPNENPDLTVNIEEPIAQKTTTVKTGMVMPASDAKKPSLIKTKTAAATLPPGSLMETFVGNWQLVSVEPKQASHRGYLKMDELDGQRVKVLSNFQFYFKRTNAEAQFVVFNGFASCASCILKKEMKITDNDIAFGTSRYTILKEDTGEGKAGDTTASMSGNSSISAQVTLQLVGENAVIIRVQQQASTPISHGFTVPPFVYTFHFQKKS